MYLVSVVFILHIQFIHKPPIWIPNKIIKCSKYSYIYLFKENNYMIKFIVYTGSYFLDVGTCNETTLVTSKELRHRHVTSGSTVTSTTVTVSIVTVLSSSTFHSQIFPLSRWFLVIRYCFFSLYQSQKQIHSIAERVMLFTSQFNCSTTASI